MSINQSNNNSIVKFAEALNNTKYKSQFDRKKIEFPIMTYNSFFD